MADLLERILEQKRLDVAAAQSERSLEDVQRRAALAAPPRDFVAALRDRHPLALIAEVKKASPSAGLIRADFEPVTIARTYAQNGAACLSVLTDEHFFQGHLSFLEQIRAAVDIPILRKDFIIDPYQVWEARAAGADCILLIAECLDDEQLVALNALAHQLGMQSLVELYDSSNLERVLGLGNSLIGINNRDLRTFKTDLQHTVRLRSRIPPEVLVVGESGIHTREDALLLQQAGVHAVLVGESLMRADDLGRAVRTLLGQRS